MPAPRSETVKKKQQARADRLKAIWEKKKSDLGLLQKDVAKRLGWKTQGAVGHVLSGGTPLTIDLLLEMCEILKVSPALIVPELAELQKYDDKVRDTATSQIRNVDLGLLGNCIKTVEDAERAQNTTLPEPTKNKLVEFLYAELAGSNRNQQAVQEMANLLLAIATPSS